MEKSDSREGAVRVIPVPEENYSNPGVLLQTRYWAALKQSFGQKPLFFKVQLGDFDGFLCLFLRRIAGKFTLAYLPHGPAGLSGFPDAPPVNLEAQLQALGGELQNHLPKSCVFLRMDPPWASTPWASTPWASTPSASTGEGNRPAPFQPPFRRAPMDIQPVSTVMLSLMGTEEEILSRMKQKTRYNVRLSQKKGVTVTENDVSSVPLWYELYKETAERDKIAIHSLDYYLRVFSRASEHPDYGVKVRLFLAWIDGVAEAGIITAQAGDTAVYLYGASSNNKREYMPAYALQWEAIRKAKQTGAAWYDFFGIPPLPGPDHPMAGLYRFKTGFGGVLVHRTGSWDLLFRPFLYSLYKAAEKIRVWYYRRFKKRGLLP